MDFYKFWQILEGKFNEWDPNEPDEGPESEYDTAHGDGEMERELRFENGTFMDVQSGKKWPPIMDPKLSEVVGEPGDIYELYVKVGGRADYTPGRADPTGGPDHDDPKVSDDIDFDMEEFWITNKRTGKQINLSRNPEVQVNTSSFNRPNQLFSLYQGGIYNVDWEFDHDKISVYIKPA